MGSEPFEGEDVVLFSDFDDAKYRKFFGEVVEKFEQDLKAKILEKQKETPMQPNTTDPTKPNFMWMKETIWNSVPEKFKWIAADDDLVVRAFTEIPWAEKYNFFSEEDEGEWIYVCGKEGYIPWFTGLRESLIERPMDYGEWVGKLCWFWGDNENKEGLHVGFCASISEDLKHKFECSDTKCRDDFMRIFYTNCRPLTEEEALNLVVRKG